jgi:hypothetical protein
MVERAFDFGCFLLSFCDHNTPTDQEFAKFADDVNEFATAGSFIQQPLRNPSVILSPLLLRILGHISNDCTTILKRLRKLLARLDSRYRTTATAATKNPFLRVGSHHKTQCHQSLKDFLGQKLVILHRSQIILAKSTFNVILAVIKWVHRHTRYVFLSNSSAVTPEKDLHDSTRVPLLLMSCTFFVSSGAQGLRLRLRRPFSENPLSENLRLEQHYGCSVFPKDRLAGSRYSTSSPTCGLSLRRIQLSLCRMRLKFTSWNKGWSDTMCTLRICKTV